MFTAICGQTLNLDSSLTQSPSFLSKGGSSVTQRLHTDNKTFMLTISARPKRRTWTHRCCVDRLWTHTYKG